MGLPLSFDAGVRAKVPQRHIVAPLPAVNRAAPAEHHGQSPFQHSF